MKQKKQIKQIKQIKSQQQLKKIDSDRLIASNQVSNFNPKIETDRD